jgi:FkbM family methyltransferase
MIKRLIRNFLNRRNYEIIKQPYKGDKYPNVSDNKNEYYCETPIGKYYLPNNFELDGVAKTLVRGKYFEPEIIETAKKYITKGSTVLDIGANFGQMSIEFSKLVGNEGKVYSFEAQNFVFNFTKKNFDANICSNVTLFENAVHNKDGETLYFPQHDLSETSIFKGAPYSGLALISDSENGVGVKTITIDSLNIETAISFIKVDVQGADLFAMQGAMQTILKHKPTIIFEFEQPVQENFQTNFNDYVEFVRSINYKFIDVVSEINYVIAPND